MPQELTNEKVQDVREKETSFLDVLGVLWRRKWTIALTVAAFLCIGTLYYLKTPPRYESKAQILLIKKEARPTGPEMAATMGYQDTLSTQMLLLKSPEIVSRAFVANRAEFKSYHAAEEPDPIRAAIAKMRQAIKSLRNDPRPQEASAEYDPLVFEIIDKHIDVAAAGETFLKEPNIIEITYRGRSPVESQRVLSEVVKSYQGFLGETYQAFGTETYDLLAHAKDEIFEELSDLKREYQQFQLASPLLQGASADGKSAMNLHEIRLVEIENARSQLLLQMAAQESRLAAMEEMLARRNRSAVAAMLEDWQISGQQTPDLRDELERLRMEALTDLGRLEHRHGADHPDVATARARVAMFDERLSNANELGRAAPLVHLDARVEAIRQEIRSGNQQLADLSSMFEAEREAARQLLEFQIKDEDYNKRIALLQTLFDDAVGKLEEMNVLKDYGGVNAHLIAAPEYGLQTAPSGLIITAISFLLGMISGVTLALVSESFDRRFRSPEDVVRTLRVPLMGHVSEFRKRGGRRWRAAVRKGQTPVAPDVVAYHDPKGRHAESLRAIRTILLAKSEEDGVKVVQFAGASPSEGASTVLSNLAVSLAKAGVKTLVVDADLRNPKLHLKLGVGNEVGLATALSGGAAEASDAAQATAIDNLWVLPAGPHVPNPADLLTSSRFHALIAALRDRYDFILLRTPPALAVSDAFAVAKIADGVVYTMRLSRTSRLAAVQTISHFESIGGKLLGVVVNRLNRRSLKTYTLESRATTPSRVAYGYSYAYSTPRGRGVEAYYLDKRHPNVPAPRKTPVSGEATTEVTQPVTESGRDDDS